LRFASKTPARRLPQLGRGFAFHVISFSYRLMML